MKKLLMVLAIVSGLAQNSMAQFDSKLSVNGGYEANIFKNPEIYEDDDLVYTKDELWANSIYNEFSVNLNYKKEWNKSHFKINTSGGGSLYYSELEANKYNYKIVVKYRTRYGKRKYFGVAPVFSRLKKEGMDQTETILTTPYSYINFILPFNFDFYLKKKTWFKIELAYNYKKYDRKAPERYIYNAGLANVSLKKKWQSRKHFIQLNFYGKFDSRYYIHNETIKNSEFNEVEKKTRLWNYYTAGTEYSFGAQNKKWRLGIPVEYIYKYDKLTDKYSYKQYSAGLSISTLSKRIYSSQKFYTNNRDYMNLMADEETNLRYTFFKYSSKFSYFLAQKTKVGLSFNYIYRLSNKKNIESKYSRSYMNYYIEIGISQEI